MQYIVELSTVEEKALTAEVASIEDWVNNAVHTRAGRAIDHVVLQYSDKQPDKISSAEKEQIVMGADIEPLGG